MAYIIQHRRDTAAHWEEIDPILADAEIGFIKPDPNNPIEELRFIGSSLYKIGDGITPWNDLPFFGFDGKLSQDLDLNSDGADVNQAVSKSALIAEFTKVWDALGVNTEDDETFEQAVNKTLKDHGDVLKVLQDFANEYGPVVDKLGEDVEKHDKDIYGFDTISTETDEETGEEVEVTVHTPGLIEKLDEAVERLDVATSTFQSSQVLTDKVFSDMEKNSMLQEGVLYLTYIEEETEEEE